MQRGEPNFATAQLGDQHEQVLQRAGQSIQARHHQGVAGAQVGQAGSQLGPVRRATGAGVGEHAQAAGLAR